MFGLAERVNEDMMNQIMQMVLNDFNLRLIDVVSGNIRWYQSVQLQDEGSIDSKGLT